MAVNTGDSGRHGNGTDRGSERHVRGRGGSPFVPASERPEPTGDRAAKLSTRGLWVTYDNLRTGTQIVALQDVTLDVAPGEFVCVVGPSGCGKTTFLKAVAGLVAPTAGEIRIDGHILQGPGRDRAVVFQSPNLLPWRTVVGNVMYGLELHRRIDRETRRRALDLIELVGLKGFDVYHPHQLSGGMQQRVNLARALAVDPELLLLDEPFAALDAQTREVMQHELMRIWAATQKTAVFITHQIDEAVFLADRVFVFGTRPGRCVDTVDVPLARPRDLRVKRDPVFLSLVDRIWAEIQEESARQQA